jgi:hypothetical protein
MSRRRPEQDPNKTRTTPEQHPKNTRRTPEEHPNNTRITPEEHPKKSPFLVPSMPNLGNSIKFAKQAISVMFFGIRYSGMVDLPGRLDSYWLGET